MSDEIDAGEVEAKIRDWVIRGNSAVMELLPLCEGINDLPAISRHKRAVMSLSTACWGTSQTVLYLVHGLRLWDAEILMRSVSEGTLKLGYILESSSTFETRCSEYRDTLPVITKLRWHARADAALKASLPDTAEWDLRPFRDLLVPEEELASIRRTYPREARNKLERQWGFTDLIEHVSKPDGAFGPTARALLHGYSLASHIYHMSYEGVDMPLERDTRDPARRAAIQKAHAARLIGDCYDLGTLRILITLRFLERKDVRLRDLTAKHEPFLLELKNAAKDWGGVEYGLSSKVSPPH